jgi:adenosylhomocysteine nucleosidase
MRLDKRPRLEMRLLMVASDAMEFRGILSHAGESRKTAAGTDWARWARAGADEWLLVAHGAGPHRAAAAMDASLFRFRPDAVISTGFCGALAADIALAEVVVATQVTGRNGSFPALPMNTGKPHRRGVVQTIDHIAQRAEEKRKWGATGACAVEMEAAAVAEHAADHSLPFYCVKAVTDLASEDMANDLNAALRADGHFDTIRILGSTLRNPKARWPELFRFRARSMRAACALGEFVADCRF